MAYCIMKSKIVFLGLSLATFFLVLYWSSEINLHIIGNFEQTGRMYVCTGNPFTSNKIQNLKFAVSIPEYWGNSIT